MEYLLTGARPWQIAKALGVDRSTVYRDIDARLKESAANCPHTDNYRQLQRERINALISRYWHAAMDGNLKAFDCVLKLMQQEAKLMGLNKPIRHEVTANVTAKRESMEDMEGMKANGHRPNGKTYKPLPVITKDMTSKEMAEAWAVIRNAPRDHPDYARDRYALANDPEAAERHRRELLELLKGGAASNGNGAANGKATGPP